MGATVSESISLSLGGIASPRRHDAAITRPQMKKIAPELAGPEARITEKGSEAADDVSPVSLRVARAKSRTCKQSYPQKMPANPFAQGKHSLAGSAPGVSMEWRKSEALATPELATDKRAPV